MTMKPHEHLTRAVRRQGDRASVVAFITAGYPSPDGFLATLKEVAGAADAVELGVPFSDPMADGMTIQRSSHAAIAQGVTLRWILDTLASRDFELEAPVLLMSYLNPLLAYGFRDLSARAAEVGVSGFIVPDLPFEESAPLRDAIASEGLGLVQLVTPATPHERVATLCAQSQGFVYAVTTTGITGGARELPAQVSDYLDRVSEASELPVCAGFGIRTPEHVRMIARHADGVIVGSALVEVLEAGKSPGAFLRNLAGNHEGRSRT
jgi:tryptophan synthase alpha chain